MEKFNRSLFSVFVLALMISACSKSDPKETPADVVTQQATVGGSSSTTGNPNPAKLTQVLCQNSISLDEPNLTPLTNKSSFPNAKFKLSQMQMHMVWESTKNSFNASSSEANNFRVILDCHGVRNAAADNSEKTYTDKDGVKHHDKISNTESLSGTFKVSEGLDLVDQIKAANQRIIEIKFRDGVMVLAESKLVPDQTEGDAKLDEIPLERMKVGEDIYITMRLYSISSDKIEIRIKFEFPKDANGQRVIQFSKATYTRI